MCFPLHWLRHCDLCSVRTDELVKSIYNSTNLDITEFLQSLSRKSKRKLYLAGRKKEQKVSLIILKLRLNIISLVPKRINLEHTQPVISWAVPSCQFWGKFGSFWGSYYSKFWGNLGEMRPKPQNFHKRWELVVGL